MRRTGRDPVGSGWLGIVAGMSPVSASRTEAEPQGRRRVSATELLAQLEMRVEKNAGYD